MLGAKVAAQAYGWEHPEAFCHIRYVALDGSGEENLIWNSRDGRSPHSVRLQSGKSAMRAFQSHRAIYDVAFKPQPGDRIIVGPGFGNVVDVDAIAPELEVAVPFEPEAVKAYLRDRVRQWESKHDDKKAEVLRLTLEGKMTARGLAEIGQQMATCYVSAYRSVLKDLFGEEEG